MKRSAVRFAGLALVLLTVVLASPMFVSAMEPTTSFKVTCATYPELIGGGDGYIVLSIPADCVGNHLGNSEFYSELTGFVVPPFPNIQYGDMVFTAADGSELYGDYNGFNVPNEYGAFTFWGTYEIDAGSGRFDGATGSGDYYGTCFGTPL
jgi:hypothetical protein